MKHHYIPAFYLRQWAADRSKGNLCEHKKVYGTVKPRGTSAEGTGYLEDLYRVEGVPLETAHNFETIFLKLVDTDAKNALDKILKDPYSPWPGRLRSAWTRFITSLLFRNPEAVTFIRNHILTMYGEATRSLQADYAARRIPGAPETYEEFMSKTDPAAPYIGTARMLQDIIDNNRVGPTVFGMQWSRLNLSRSKVPLLTSDRPLEMPKGLGQRDAYIALPIGPYDMFLAAHDAGIGRAAGEANPTELVKKINRTTVQRARLYVWGVDDHQLPFVQKHFGKLPDREILTPKQVQQALNAAKDSRAVPERVDTTPPASVSSLPASTAPG
ncbi:hypothetical protein ASD45_09760 [Pseudolabrys sp. Root1462]|uniref:DUF4238 domain-containing protein n=1 Tax=Pseudolabrys sp. Root1462 TaxID=1736466 RepID=UPI0007027D95|nr:DUF4238 domain-containing protein [Pseudolabrys sp. Root1462]KQZ01114.1 hypothetical protein ASD45_09760 [Pseudolabrys sp. Root1462]